ncbi:enoyl-CoA hydratase/isomerase family protein [Gammaproteobacteria bacterium]|jgi:enoyl-CoA hydratase/carnithine racemase|nr:enoyl-CoA hydratase/isomerase family protein [bacterium]MDA9296772.1 enoyl-CoA hydratase/isomerase family protein [Gammaproteobacteria bacterium]|tara:strand:- start:220 stop:1014 length:795 start_codon:yes stop_codon:yes gene_type:complete
MRVPVKKYTTLNYSVESGIARIELDNPPLNLINEESTLEYHSALRAVNDDETARVLILSGAGRGLSAGVDLKYLMQFESTDMERFLRLFYVETLNIVRGLSIPVIAEVHGYAREGACTLAFACDMIIAADDANFGYPGVPNLAGPPGMHVWFLQRLIGRMRAAELIFTGEAISAQEAYQLGLITKIVPRNKLSSATEKLALKLCQMSPLALKRTRDLMYQMEDMPFAQVPDAALRALSATFDSQDGKEAKTAFIEKRKPKWTGR